MKFSLRGLMKSTPSLKLINHIDPLSASISAKASGTAQIGKLSVTISKIPVHLRIPFLKRTHRALLIGSVGGATLSIDPFSISAKEVSLNGTGQLGDKNGITMTNDVSVKCQTSMDAEGAVAGKVGLGSIDLGCLHPSSNKYDHSEQEEHYHNDSDDEHEYYHRHRDHNHHYEERNHHEHENAHYDRDDDLEPRHDAERHEHHEEDKPEYRTPPLKSKQQAPIRKTRPVKIAAKKTTSSGTAKSNKGQRRS